MSTPEASPEQLRKIEAAMRRGLMIYLDAIDIGLSREEARKAAGWAG